MTDDEVVLLAANQLAKASASRPDRPRPAETHLAQAVNWNALSLKFLAQSTAKADGEFGQQARAAARMTSQRQQHGLDAAVKVPRPQVKDLQRFFGAFPRAIGRRTSAECRGCG
jgi:hypothetical protein